MRGGKLFFIILLLLLSSACSTLAPSVIVVDDKESDCRYLFSEFERRVINAGRLDSQSARVSGYPYLRVNRFLLSYRNELDDDLRFDMWVAQMMALAQEAHHYEWKNLPSESRLPLSKKLGIAQSFSERLVECGDYLWEIDREEARSVLPELVEVPGEYRISWRVFGLYPLTSWFVSNQVKKLHRKLEKPFFLVANELPVSGTLTRYALPDDNEAISPQVVAEILSQSSDNPLGIPLPKQEKLDFLFSRYAPIWEIDQVTDDDRIGQPFWGGSQYPSVDVSVPAVYTFVSYARFDGKVLLQLNYTIWFPARPRSGLFDLYGGLFDGITWRVTLGGDGRPLIYDAMHNCGCYHQWFLGGSVALRREEAKKELEPPLALQAPEVMPGEHMVLRLNSADHFLLNIYSAEPSGSDDRYVILPYGELRSLKYGLSDDRLSLFNNEGIVPGTQRAERWFLWPMGVPSPGSMRQVGHHVIVFAGKRYFDEPHLLDRFFIKK